MKARNAAPQSEMAYTLVEILVVVLVLAILMAVAVPLYLNATAGAQRSTCRSNMQLIANAEETYKVANVNHLYVAIASGVNMVTAGLSDLTSTPTCPNGGKYAVLTTGNTADGRAVPANRFAVQCNFGGTTHGSYIPGIDNQ